MGKAAGVRAPRPWPGLGARMNSGRLAALPPSPRRRACDPAAAVRAWRRPVPPWQHPPRCCRPPRTAGHQLASWPALQLRTVSRPSRTTRRRKPARPAGQPGRMTRHRGRSASTPGELAIPAERLTMGSILPPDRGGGPTTFRIEPRDPPVRLIPYSYPPRKNYHFFSPYCHCIEFPLPVACA
jgi:hypothetical protein